ncbi:glutamate--cysteine ligase [Orenia metallireducens]|jgi:glutamate--cysteine ligase|uniref:Glutamate--cysteine ligase n=1 Tax=Orenia metallireducens TaxID=1413210 RepID=A0A1C0A8Y1_9FIRM|nr:glutamate-cysteine ligase family protein [Orenia metallireducens]OCL26688.1 glutamate--cysteine ligase [Orenia metallireducens]
MKSKDLKEKLISYFRAGECQIESLGMEIEHFVVEKDTLKSVGYREIGGVKEVLKELEKKGWEGQKEGGKLIGLKSAKADITLEPGGQLEIGISPQEKIEDLKKIYLNFLDDIIPILEEKGYWLINLGYQLHSKIEEIDWNAKERYKMMSNYLAKTGKYAHNMMKGTSALQVALDYKDEEDFIKKFRIANTLSPVLSSLLDNSPFFESEVYEGQALRTVIWDNTDNERCGIVKEAFDDDFGYEKYAEYILSRRPILIKSGGEYIPTFEQNNYQIFAKREFDTEELEHILTMVFPDVRAKQFIEIRMADSLPPEYSFAVVALWKGLFYNQEVLDKAYNFIRKFSLADVLSARKEIINRGIEAYLGEYKMVEIGQKLLDWVKLSLKPDEVRYLSPLLAIINSKETLANKVKKELKLKGKREVIKGHILNLLIKEDN